MNTRGSIFGQIPPVTKNLIIINFIVWLAMFVLPGRLGARLEEFGGLHYFTASGFNPVQFVTYMFMHSTRGFAHIFFNMFSLWMFGTVLERTFGSARFLFYYMSCGIGAAMIQLGVFAFMIHSGSLPEGVTISDIVSMHVPAGFAPSNPDVFRVWNLINTEVIGASGAVFGILLAFGYMFPKAPLYLFFIPVPIQARWIVLGYGAIELLQSFNNNPGDNVAHVAHLGGMLVGFMILLYWKKKGLFNNGGIY